MTQMKCLCVCHKESERGEIVYCDCLCGMKPQEPKCSCGLDCEATTSGKCSRCGLEYNMPKEPICSCGLGLDMPSGLHESQCTLYAAIAPPTDEPPQEPICSCNDFQHDTDICDVHGKKGQEPAPVEPIFVGPTREDQIKMIEAARKLAPREFWVVDAEREGTIACMAVIAKKDLHKYVDDPSDAIHVIEYSAYQKLKEENERLKNERG